MRVSLLITLIFAKQVFSTLSADGNVLLLNAGNGDLQLNAESSGQWSNYGNASALANGMSLGFGGASMSAGMASGLGNAAALANGMSLGLGGASMSAGMASGLGNGGDERIVSSQRMSIKPRYITERIRRKPRVITETVVTPVYETTVNQPRVERTRVTLTPRFNRQADVVRNSRRVEATRNTNSLRVQTVDVPADVLEIQPITRAAVLERRENVNFAPGMVQNQNTAPRTLATRRTNSMVNRSASRPGDLTNNRLYIQPTLERAFVNVQLNRGQTRTVNHQPTSMPVDSQQRTRVQRVTVPANQIVNQRVVRPSVTREEVQVKFVPSQPVTETRQAIIRPTIRTKQVRRKFYNVEYKVPVERTVRVRVPNYIKVNDYRTVHVPVDEQGNELNVAGSGFRVLGGAGLDNAALARAQGNVRISDVLNAQDTMAEAAAENGNMEFAAGLEAGAELLSAASSQNMNMAANAQAAAMAAAARNTLMSGGAMNAGFYIGKA